VAAAEADGAEFSSFTAATVPGGGLGWHPRNAVLPFHCYSLQQATADGYVLDVLQRFVAVTPRFQISGLQLTQQQQRQLLSLDKAVTAAAAAAAANTGNNSVAAASSSSLQQQQQQQQPSLAEELLIQAASNSRQLVAVEQKKWSTGSCRPGVKLLSVGL